jgi:hypothetical protein
VNLADVGNVIEEVQHIATQVGDTIKVLDPVIAPETQTVEAIVTLLSNLVAKALEAYGAASAEPITIETITALLPNPAPMKPPPV